MEHLARVLRFYGPYLLSLVGMERGQREMQQSGGEGAHGTNDTEIDETPKVPTRGKKKNKKLKTKINDKNDEIERLKSQVQNAESQLQKAKSQLQKAESQLQKAEERKNALQATVTALKDQIDRAHVDGYRKTNKQIKIESLQQSLSKARNEKDEVKKTLSKEIEKLNIEIDNLKKEPKEQEESIKQLETDISVKEEDFEKIITSNQEEFKNYAREMKCEVKQKEADMVRLKAELTKALAEEKKKHDSEKKDLLLRLSKVTGANLTLDNPNIADLSDEERPTKLAEEFSELYDNEWTDTFEVLKTDEKDRTTFMLHLLQRASTICQQISNDHMQSIKESLCSLTLRTQLPKRIDVGTNEMFGIDKNEKKQVLRNEVITMPFDSFQTDQRKIVMDLRKFVEKQLSNQLEMEVANVIASENDINLEGEETVIKYIKKCVNICWTMCQHEPPVHVDFPDLQVDHKFDTNVFKPYTKSGKYLHFIVWPALYLYKDGPMLCKGVAQGNN